MANVLSESKRVAVVSALVEGNSIRAAARMAGVSKDTVMKLLVDLGAACAAHLDGAMQNLPCKRLQVDEIWSFCYSKQKNVPADKRGTFGYGDVWTFTAICADTKLVPSFLVGSRDAGVATEFMQDLAGRLTSPRVQITTDGHAMYVSAIEDAFGSSVDYAQLIKIYGADPEPDKRYSPAQCIGCTIGNIKGNPAPEHVSTSYVERQNLTMRMSIRRFTRLTNAFSKKLANHAAAVALYAMHYNFCRMHKTLRMTPAMKAGIARQPWKIEDLVALLPPARHAGGRPRKTT